MLTTSLCAGVIYEVLCFTFDNYLIRVGGWARDRVNDPAIILGIQEINIIRRHNHVGRSSRGSGGS